MTYSVKEDSVGLNM